MYMYRFFIFFALVFSQISAQESEVLKLSAVPQVMQQLFKQHVDKKEMSTTIIENGLKVYIDQFDPKHIYLLESEARPYLMFSKSQSANWLNDYKRGEFTEFTQLNDTIKKSISRARDLRKELENRPGAIIYDKPHTQNPYASNVEELKIRIRNDMADFFNHESPNSDRKKMLVLYNREQQSNENPYIGIDEAGQAFSISEQENQLSLRILKALASGLDVHTGVLNAHEAEIMRMRLEKKFEGIGVHLRKKGNDVIVSGFVDGSPAARSKSILVNDRLMEVDGRKISGIPLETVIEWLRGGEENSPVAIALQRNNDPNLVHVKLHRADIPINEGRVESSFERYRDGIIGKVVIHSFYQGDKDVSTANDLRQSIAKLNSEGNLIGLILDLRDNSGGFLLQAVKVVGDFITEGIVVVSKYSTGEEHFYRNLDISRIYDGPLVVLTSKETASAAEIVAQALQDYGVAIVVGDERTFGKGTVQNQTITGNDASSFFKVTVGKYYTVSGRTPQLRGVKADIVVPSLFYHDAIGEEYLEGTISADKIAPLYNDPLSDIPQRMKSWYQHYYVDNIQKKETQWLGMLPQLKKRSEQRLNNNVGYYRLIQEENSFSDSDPQMKEAVNIVKDMIVLERMHNKKLVAN